MTVDCQSSAHFNWQHIANFTVKSLANHRRHGFIGQTAGSRSSAGPPSDWHSWHLQQLYFDFVSVAFHANFALFASKYRRLRVFHYRKILGRGIARD